MTLQPIRRETAVETCARTLQAAILAGELPAGQRLPPERALAERLGVNRVTLRGALGRLAATGLLQTRQGSGHLVNDFLEVGGPELVAALAVQTDRAGFTAIAADLLRVRRHLARGVLELIVEHAPIDPAPVAAAVDRFAATAERTKDLLELAQADLEVLAALVALTGSVVMRLCLNPVAAALRNLPALRETIYAEPSQNLLGYEGLLAWLEAPDAAGLEMLVAFLAQNDAENMARFQRARKPSARRGSK